MKNKTSILFTIGSLTLASCAVFGPSEQSYLTSAQTNLSNNNPQNALESSDKAILKNPNNYYAYYLRAKAYQRLNNPESALTNYQQAMKIKNTDPQVMVSYADFLCSQQDYGKAEALYNSAFHHNIESGLPVTNLYVNYADCKITQNKLDDAITAYTKALADESAPVAAYVGVTYAYLLQKNYPTANYYADLYTGKPDPDLTTLKISILKGLISTTNNPSDKEKYIVQLNQLTGQLNSISQIPPQTEGTTTVLSKVAPASAFIAPSTPNSTEPKQVIIVRNANQNTISNSQTSSQIQGLASRIKTASDGRRYIIVASGETLLQVSQKTGVSVTELKILNKLKSGILKTGQRIYLN